MGIPAFAEMTDTTLTLTLSLQREREIVSKLTPPNPLFSKEGELSRTHPQNPSLCEREGRRRRL
jgi:hypothetical protein